MFKNRLDNRSHVALPVALCNRAIGVTIERNGRIHEIPYLFVGGVGYEGRLLVLIYTVLFLAIYIAAQLRTLVYRQASLAFLGCQMRKGCTKQTGAYYEIIVNRHNFIMGKRCC